jgi:hypothetical protein
MMFTASPPRAVSKMDEVAEFLVVVVRVPERGQGHHAALDFVARRNHSQRQVAVVMWIQVCQGSLLVAGGGEEGTKDSRSSLR